MPHAIRIHVHGGPEVLQWEAVPAAGPGPGEVLIRQTAIGLNFIDVYERTGLYPGALPSGLGREGAGVIEALGPRVRGLKVGDRVAYVSSRPGAYAQERVVAANRVVKVPDGVSDRLAAAAILKGLTAWFLVRRTHRVARGDAVVVHAAAGGVGLILAQWASLLGARVIGVVGSDAKAETAREHGCQHVLVLGRDDLPGRVRELTGGAGAHVVYDSVGKDTWAASLASVRLNGLVVSFGSASGNPPPFDVGASGRQSAPYVHRATMINYMTTPEIAAASAAKVFAMVKKGLLKTAIDESYRLKDVVKLHRDAEARKTTGQIIMVP